MGSQLNVANLVAIFAEVSYYQKDKQWAVH